MSFSLLAPLGLVALAALALPILIHLIRRIELRTTDFAALRWIAERVRPRRRIRFERPWLLLLRLVLLALLAVLLAHPVLSSDTRSSRPWVVVAPGVDRGAARAAVPGVDADWHWLAPGYPLLDNAPISTEVPLASLLRELDAELPAAGALIVVVPDELQGLDGERPRLAHAIDWRIVPGRMPGSDAAPATAPIRLALRYAPEAETSLAYLRAAVAAWNAREPRRYELDAQPTTAPIPADAHWLIWLAAQPPPAVITWIERGGIALLANDADTAGSVVWRDAGGNVLARGKPSGQGRVLALPGALTPATLPILLDADFPDLLLAAFRDPAPAPTRARAETMRPLHAAIAAASARRAPDATRPLDAWLGLLIASLFLIERFVATRPREAAAP